MRTPFSLMQVWTGLITLTLASTMSAETARHASAAVIAIFTIAAVKAELVLGNFMEAGRAERHWLWI